MSRNTLCIFFALLAAVAGCERFESEEERERERAIGAAAAAGPSLPAGVIRLAGELQHAADIRTQPAKTAKVADQLRTAGWLATPMGREVVVKSPSAGFIRPPAGAKDFLVGGTIAGQASLGILEILLSPIEQAQLIIAKEEADAIVNQAQVTLQLASSQLEKVKSARDSTAGTRILDLEEIVRKAQIAYQEGRERLPFLPDEPYGNMAKVKPTAIDAPIAGRILQVHVSPRQFVLAGDPLWTISDWSTLWLRVPIFQADLAQLDSNQTALVTVPGAARPVSAKRVALPPATTPGSRTVELIYELANADANLHAGQAVEVSLPLALEHERVVVPSSCVLFDGLGATWVYLQSAPDEFRRRRVELGASLDGQLVIERGLTPGETIVTQGAETLYGHEFKSDLPMGDDD